MRDRKLFCRLLSRGWTGQRGTRRGLLLHVVVLERAGRILNGSGSRNGSRYLDNAVESIFKPIHFGSTFVQLGDELLDLSTSVALQLLDEGFEVGNMVFGTLADGTLCFPIELPLPFQLRAGQFLPF